MKLCRLCRVTPVPATGKRPYSYCRLCRVEKERERQRRFGSNNVTDDMLSAMVGRRPETVAHTPHDPYGFERLFQRIANGNMKYLKEHSK